MFCLWAKQIGKLGFHNLLFFLFQVKQLVFCFLFSFPLVSELIEEHFSKMLVFQNNVLSGLSQRTSNLILHRLRVRDVVERVFGYTFNLATNNTL